MPKNVKKIGIITSPTGAVIEDIINVSTRRNPYINLVLFPTKVQGIGAENEVIQGLHYFENRSDIDLIIIARGGGSFEDLNVFNTESLAREVYKSKKFIISAIGHEIDYTILDFVADLRAPTPSASAELAVEDIATKKEIFQAKSKKFLISLEHFLQQKQYAMKAQKNLINNVIVSYSNEIKHEIILKKVKLEKLNPSTILKLGYARVIKEQKTILSKKELKPSDRVTLVFHDGSVCADVKEKESGTRNSN